RETLESATCLGCLNMCGMCPSCVFAPKPPGSTPCVWKVSDEFRRRFLVELLLRCRNVQVLENIQNVLGVTSWTLFTYARSRGPTSPQDHPCRSTDRALDGKPLGMDINEVWDWFSSSPDWMKSCYLCRLFSLCDSELLRMVANLTSVLLVRQKRGFLQLNWLLEEHTLRRCEKVCQYWQNLAKETMEEIKFRRHFQDQIKTMMKVRYFYVKPFEAAYAKIKTKTVQMEERNVYCGAYFTKVLLNKEDPHRVVDYRGRSFMATGSKDRAVHLFYVASETKAVSVMKGHIGSIRAVLLCEDRDLVITASCDASIRCWSLKTDRCEMELYGHTGTVNCLDVHADRLVSGAKDCLVKVWNLQTGNRFEDFNFKHPSSIQCVKINTTTVYSSCDRGLVKIWDMEKASLLRVRILSVKCLFFDEWHLLSGDVNGQVMAWSVNCHAKECLMTFSHPKEVKSLTLVYLRVVTGCVDGKIRIFNFLTGDFCKFTFLSRIFFSLPSFSILVNTTSSVRLYQFAKVFWESAERSPGDVPAQDGSVSEKCAASLRKLPCTSFEADHKAQLASPSRKMHDCDSKKPERAELRYHTRFLFTPTKCQTQGKHAQKYVRSNSVILSEKATCERMKKRGLHRPLTRDSILLRVSAIQRAQCTDEVSVNMECNAKLRDSWGPHMTQDPLHSDIQALKHRRAKTCDHILKRGASQTITNTDVTTAPNTTRRHHHCLFSKETQTHTADTQRAIKRVGAKEGPQAPERILTTSLPNLEYGIKTATSLPKINPFGPIQREGVIQAGRRCPVREGTHAEM
uniref:F-box and WD repeat domain containing 10 n=1 Tax=Seriola lalandi dorsalis TaxID=1841481 RepID=A0A3B4XB73_SERLL